VDTFTYLRADGLASALSALAAPGVVPLGGGTDLLVEMEEGLRTPARLVDVRPVPELQGIARQPDGSLRVGGAVSLAALERDPIIGSSFGVLATACAMSASSALRNMGTLGGNLCQRPRCWYFRRGVRCFKRGGDDCPAVQGENRHLAIFRTGPCHAVHASDPAVALTALDATLEVARLGAARSLTVSELYVVPNADPTRETVLADGEVIVNVVLPNESAGGVQHYEKLMQREAWDFALVSLAAVKRVDGAVRLVLGGVAARPWRISESVEEDVASGGLSDDDYATLADRALYDVTPLSQNGYKVKLAAALLVRGMQTLHAS
jgi:xanthine dehydrogenase YagS FAD-binding subunit